MTRFTPWAFLLLSLTLLTPKPSAAADPKTLPPELQTAIAQVNQAANQRDLNQLGQWYSPDFMTEDGLNRQTFFQSLQGFWQQYPQVSYTTEVMGWEQKGDQIQVDTVTKMNGSGQPVAGKVTLSGSLRSRQFWQNQKLVRQEILGEDLTLSSGTNPPAVRVQVPDRVKAGNTFNFDVIVLQPMGDDVLLGGVREDRVSPSFYLKPAEIPVQPLTAGGIFKRVSTSRLPEQRWLSAMIVRDGGITVVSRRVRIANEE